MKRIKFVGLDVHAETIAVAVAEQDGEVRSLGALIRQVADAPAETSHNAVSG
jgi:hypothetical protein